MACVDLIRGCYTQKHVGRKIRQMQIRKTRTYPKSCSGYDVHCERCCGLFWFVLVISREKEASRWREVHKKCKSFEWEWYFSLYRLNNNYVRFHFISVLLHEGKTVGSLSFRPCKQALHLCLYIKAKKKRKKKNASFVFICTTDMYCKQI